MRETEGGRKADKQREAQTSHLLIHSTKAQDLGIYQGLPFAWQGSEYLSQHLLTPLVCLTRSLDEKWNQDSNPGALYMECGHPSSSLTNAPNAHLGFFFNCSNFPFELVLFIFTFQKTVAKCGNGKGRRIWERASLYFQNNPLFLRVCVSLQRVHFSIRKYGSCKRRKIHHKLSQGIYVN